ncbi:hypothetical protein U9M48_032614 [Paspalum notatum var. saurae]|uniref:Uncharacterized protein n=1 Tax=Paspalum notatum var. saurae TaxID=547442 RepID=A0AAQ3U551_PASNO
MAVNTAGNGNNDGTLLPLRPSAGHRIRRTRARTAATKTSTHSCFPWPLALYASGPKKLVRVGKPELATFAIVGGRIKVAAGRHLDLYCDDALLLPVVVTCGLWLCLLLAAY